MRLLFLFVFWIVTDHDQMPIAFYNLTLITHFFDG